MVIKSKVVQTKTMCATRSYHENSSSTRVYVRRVTVAACRQRVVLSSLNGCGQRSYPFPVYACYAGEILGIEVDTKLPSFPWYSCHRTNSRCRRGDFGNDFLLPQILKCISEAFTHYGSSRLI